jgi:hypothetical protein
MKYLFFILSLVCFVCNAQSPILSLYDDEYGAVNGAYYKDTHNDLDNYTGTWKYTNGNTSLTITLQKKVMVPYYDKPNEIYEDILVGEYKYIENGVEKINTLSQLLLELPETGDYNIFGNTIIGPESILCNGCSPTDRKMLLLFKDPTCYIPGYDPQMILQRVDSGGIQKLRLKFRPGASMIVDEGVTPPCTEYKIPFGEYTMTKQ